jgi:isopenicillin N synthase-like dioxygenase
VINIADCMARWTNDLFQSTIHRAINRSGVERYSVPMFFGVDYERTIDVGAPLNCFDVTRLYLAVSAKNTPQNTHRWLLGNG